MEDAHATVLDLQAADSAGATPADEDSRLSFFGVYDGHGGDKVALFSGENIHKIVAKQEAFKKGDVEQALKDGFLATDRAILTSRSTHVPEGYLLRPLANACQTPDTRRRFQAALLPSRSFPARRFTLYVRYMLCKCSD